MKRKINRKCLPAWSEGETKIKNEIDWLRNAIETFSDEDEKRYGFCKECFLRQVAILIVTGHVRAREIRRKPPLKSFWQGIRKYPSVRVYHGAAWHRETMEQVENHFSRRGYKVVREPNLYWGRADLGVHKKRYHTLFIEIGTVSLFKLFINLRAMRNFIYLVVPNDEKLIEFRSIIKYKKSTGEENSRINATRDARKTRRARKKALRAYSRANGKTL